VRYTDGDQEDYDGKELSKALELYYKTTKKGGDFAHTVAETSGEQSDDENETISSGSDDEESYIPSPEVHKWHLWLNQLFALQLRPFPLQTEKTCSQKQNKKVYNIFIA
jgi:hypothetical protein